MRIFYGWWIVIAAFLNLCFVVGILFYGFPVFYPSLIDSLGFTRAQLTTGFLLGFVVAALPFGLLAGALIDHFGAQRVIWVGAWLVGLPLIMMGHMTRLWHFYVLCVIEVIGYVLSGPIPNQVLIANWFEERRGRAMGYAYLGLGLGGALSPLMIEELIRRIGWRHALEATGTLILLILLPVARWVTKSTPREVGLRADGNNRASAEQDLALTITPTTGHFLAEDVRCALKTANFWLLVTGCILVIGAIGAVTQHLVLFLKDAGYSLKLASRVTSVMVAASLAGRIIVGHWADRTNKKNLMAMFYALLGVAIPLLLMCHRPFAVWGFALVFGFALGADYMLIPLLTAECFGLSSLGKLLAVIISAYSLGQWIAPWLTGKIFDAHHSYDLAWSVMSAAVLLGAAAIFAIEFPSKEPNLAVADLSGSQSQQS